MTEDKQYDIVVIGGGAAGLMCAYSAASGGSSVLIIEKSRRLGGKIAISGGGKCNFTNLDCSSENFYCSNRHFVKSALARFSQWDFIAMLDEAGIQWQQREHGRLFCEHSAGEIVGMLEGLCRKNNVQALCNCPFESVSKAGDGFNIHAGGESYYCKKLVVACGGSAWPQCGAGPDGYEIAKQFGIELIEPEPALVPLQYNRDDLKDMVELSGISLEVAARCNNASFSEELLFTHAGLSGPAILQVSNLWRPNQNISIDFIPGTSIRELIEKARVNHGSIGINRLLLGKLPQKLIKIWQQRYWPDTPVANLSGQQIEATCSAVNNWQFIPASTAGMRKAEATRGGVSCDELSSKDMQARKVPGLYFIGEVVDVTGQLGGYNLQWAWSSGYCCGQEL